ncbi:MAG: alcohol dehydrogenase [Acidobacteria bacterium]|nr:MAG: alcohol dehydrogenase [Acidobacteriota bacterium]
MEAELKRTALFLSFVGIFTVLSVSAQQRGPVRVGEQGLFGPAGPLPADAGLPSRLDKLTRVTDAMLENPPAGDWLVWRRTYDSLGFSPLKQVDKTNVRELQPSWSWSLPPGPNEMTPLIHDGVMFMYSYGDQLQALDAVTGDLLWQYRRELPPNPQPGAPQASVKKNIAIYGDRLLVPTSDLHMLALNAKTGKIIWDHEIVADRTGLNLTGGPVVAKGRVLQGLTGQRPGGSFIVAMSIETGEEAWRFNTLARPGEPGGETWNDLPLEKRSGGSVWTAGSYDPELNLVYFGPAPTYDTGPLLRRIDKPGVTNDALYTDATIALNPETGKLVWHYQHQPNDQWDLDWAFERQVIRLPVNGTTRKLVVTGGKMAIFDAVDAATGQYVFSKDMGLQNVVTAIDPKTGAKTINPETIPGDRTRLVCPHAGGARSWIATSYNPDTKILYVPLVESCMDMVPVTGRGSLSSGVRWDIRDRPNHDGKYGRLDAVNLETKQVVWSHREFAPSTTAALATAGGLVFAGTMAGKVLWQIRLNDVPSSFPISYSVDGKQYIAVVVGNGGAQARTWTSLVKTIHNPPDGGATIWVFALPGIS